MISSHIKGQIGECLVKAKLLEMNLFVFEDTFGKGKYDFLVLNNITDKIFKVEVKTSAVRKFYLKYSKENKYDVLILVDISEDIPRFYLLPKINVDMISGLDSVYSKFENKWEIFNINYDDLISSFNTLLIP